MAHRLVSLFFLITAFISLCGVALCQTKEIYTNPQFSKLAAEHKLIAILPFQVTIGLRPNQRAKVSDEDHRANEDKEAFSVQSALYSYFLKKSESRALKVAVQDEKTTNSILAKRNLLSQDSLRKYTPQELCGLLGVDAILSGEVKTDKPMSDGASVALGLMVGFYGATNSGTTYLKIHDGATGQLLWKFDKTLSRSLGSDNNTVYRTLMRKASKYLPYITQAD